MPLILDAGFSLKERRLKATQKWIAKNRERRRAQLSRWYFKNKARISANYRKWRIANQKKRSEYNRKWLANKPGLAAEYRRSWCNKNPEKIKESARKSRLKRIEKIREYMHAYAKRYYKKNRARILQCTKKYAQTHPEIRKKAHDNYCKNHPDRVRAHNKAGSSKRKARMRGADVSDTRINALIRRWRINPTFVCFYCRKVFNTSKLHVDHVQPIAKGGKHSVSNICKSCPKCNLQKRAKLVGEVCVNGQQILI